MSDRSIEQQQPHPSDDVDERSRALAAHTLQELGQELETLLDGFCSDGQRRFILDQQIASAQQLQQIRQTIQQIRNASGDLIQGHNSETIRQSLTRVSLEMLEYYQIGCQRRRLLHLSADMTQQLTGDWHQLSEMFEQKAKEQAQLSQVYDRLRGLPKAWKRPQQIERLLTALLATNFDLPDGAYLVVVDRQNYCQLGLKRKAIGSRQLIFDTSRIGRKEQMDEVARVCDRFGSVFGRNAQHNLAQIEAQVQLAQLSLLSSRLDRLHREIYQRPPEDDDDLAQVDPQASCNKSLDQAISGNSIGPSMPEARPLPPQPDLQLPLQGASSLIYIQDQTVGLQNLPIPSFVPSPWEWHDLLKVRRPYSPRLFGLFKHRRRPSSSSAAATPAEAHTNPTRFWHLFSRNTMPLQQGPPHESGEPTYSARAEEKEVTFASVSFQSLCSHFCRRGRQFYEDLVGNAQIKQSQDRRMLQEIGRDLVKVYAAIQLQASRAQMHRVLAILHDMALIENQQFLHQAWEQQPSEPVQNQVRSASRTESNNSS